MCAFFPDFNCAEIIKNDANDENGEILNNNEQTNSGLEINNGT